MRLCFFAMWIHAMVSCASKEEEQEAASVLRGDDGIRIMRSTGKHLAFGPDNHDDSKSMMQRMGNRARVIVSAAGVETRSAIDVGRVVSRPDDAAFIADVGVDLTPDAADHVTASHEHFAGDQKTATEIADEAFMQPSNDEQLPSETTSKANCLSKPGMAWFQGPPGSGFNGCRDWHPGRFCSGQVFAWMKASAGEFRSDLKHALKSVSQFSVTQGSGVPGDTRLVTRVCALWHNPCRSIMSWHNGKKYDSESAILVDGRFYEIILRYSFERTVRGVNYGARFLYESLFSRNLQSMDNGKYVTPLFEWYSGLVQGLIRDKVELYKSHEKFAHIEHECLADAPAVDCSGGNCPMANFLDQSIQENHFREIAEKGFNTIRLPLGYWNLISLEGDSTPSGPPHISGVPVTKRWKNLQDIMSPVQYQPYIDRVFKYARQYNLTVLLDFHGAPGGQSPNGNCGTDLGGSNSGQYFFDGEKGWNTDLSIRALRELGKICYRHKETCYGIELLNEPNHFWDMNSSLNRHALYYNVYWPGIRAIREEIKWDMTKPLIIMDWMLHIKNYWIGGASDHMRENKQHLGIIYFATHVYNFGGGNTPNEVCSAWKNELKEYMQAAETLGSKSFPMLVTEYGMNAQDQAMFQDSFGDLIHNTVTQVSPGSFVWNYDGPGAWGPVKNSAQFKINWSRIWHGQHEHAA